MLLTTLWTAALAGALEVITPDNAEVYVDRAAVPNTRQVGQHVAHGLPPGMHEVEIRIGRRMVDNVWVEVPRQSRVRVEWAPGEAGSVFSVFAPQPEGRPSPAPAPPPPGPPAAPAGPRPMTPAAFKGFRAQLEASSFDSGRMGMLETAAAHNVFSAAQVARVLATFSFDNQRAQAACLLAPRVLDPKNAHVIAQSFDFASSRNEAMACFR